MTTSAPSRALPQVTFPGQAAAPEGPVDVTGMYLIHHAFRRDLARFCSAAAGTPLGDRRTWAALDRRWTLFAGMLHSHHTGEDAILWPVLLDRARAAGDEAALATLTAMESEHDEIDPLLTGCRDGFRRLAESADADGLAALRVRLAAAYERLSHHLGHEEAQAMALVQHHLSDDEWHALDRRFQEHYPRDAARYGLPWVLSGVPADLLPVVRSFLGPVPYVVGRLLLAPGYERRERWVFRYASDAQKA